MADYTDDLRLAHVLADTVERVTVPRFRSEKLQVRSKPDMTPVTDADIDAEELIRGQLKRARSRDSVLGEEGGQTGSGPRRWIIDPIDGTKNYVRGVPVWATLIALLDDGVPVVGVVSAPAMTRRWWASADSGAWRTADGGSPKRMEVSGVTELSDASVSFSSLSGWKERGLLDGFLSLSDATWRLRGYGDFYSYCLVAEGAVDAACEPEVSLWDLAALSVIVTEAGGRFTSLAGEDGPHGGDAVATNGALHDAVLAQLMGS